MIKNTVINAELGYALATARHKDAIVICDANMPIPDGCNVIDVSLIRGVPTLEQTMCAIMNDLVAERYEVFELMPQYNDAMYQKDSVAAAAAAWRNHQPGSLNGNDAEGQSRSAYR